MNEQNHHETLFRGFHPCKDGDTTIYVEGNAVNGRWVEGFLSKSRDMSEKPCVLKYCIDHEENDVMFSAIILPSTVCPYTGLTDKNGRKIFKGDIVRERRICDEQTQDNIYTVDFKMQMFVAKNAINGHTVSFCTITIQSMLEVIGTIFDKPKEATP